jgi:hypothetical protein
VGLADLSLWRARFPELDPSAPIVLSLDESRDQAIGVLEDLVSLFGVSEISVSKGFRGSCTALKRLHERAPGGIVLLQDLNEEIERQQSYRLPRASVLDDESAAALPHVLMLDRPLHVIIAPASTPDPWSSGRRLCDTGSNVLSFERFLLGARA